MSQIKSRSNSIGAITNLNDNKKYCYDGSVRFRSCSNEEMSMIFENPKENKSITIAVTIPIPIKRRERDSSFPADRSITKSPNVHSVMKYLHIFENQRRNSLDN